MKPMNKLGNVITGSIFIIGSLYGQSDNDPQNNDILQLEESVVTGLLWESELQKTTASVSVLEKESFEASGAQHLEDIVNNISNLTWTGGTSRPRYIQIRGIGENSQFEGETPDSSVRFLVDDFDFTGLGTIGNLFDSKQVEILRGPQAGSFGVNAAGGVVKIVTEDPTPYWTGKVESTVGSDHLLAGGFAIGGPILDDRLTFRAHLYQLNQDGFKKNRFLNKEDTNKRDELNSQLKIRWKPSEEWTLDGAFFYADFDNGYDEFVLSNHNENSFSDQPGKDQQESFGTSLRAKFTGWDLAAATSVTQLNHSDIEYSYDSDWGAGTNISGAASSGYSGFMYLEKERDVFSQEIRLDSSDLKNKLEIVDRWTVGSYLSQMEEKSVFDYVDEFGTGAGSSSYDTKSIAIFGKIGKDFSSSTRIQFGARAEYHDVHLQSKVTEDYYGSLVSGIVDSGKENLLFGGKITLEQDLNEDHLLFISAARGYKAAGANNGGFLSVGDPTSYDEETVWNYETGIRSSFAEGKISSKWTAFYMDRQDAQLRDSSGSGGFFRYFTSNQGSAQHYGIESEILWYANQNWSFSGGLGLMETELEKTKREISNSPTYTYSLRSDFTLENGFFANLEYVGSDSYFESNSHNEKRSAYNVLNGAFGYEYQNWKLTLWSRNILDFDYEDRIFFFDNYDPFNPGVQRYEGSAAPRQFGGTLNYAW